MTRWQGALAVALAVLGWSLFTSCRTSHEMAVWQQRAEATARTADSVVAVNKELTRQAAVVQAVRDSALHVADSLRALRLRPAPPRPRPPLEPLPPDTVDAAAWRTVARAERAAREKVEDRLAEVGEQARVAVLETEALRAALTAADARIEIEARGRLLALGAVDSLRVVIRAAPIPKGPCRIPLIGVRCDVAAFTAGVVTGVAAAR